MIPSVLGMIPSASLEMITSTSVGMIPSVLGMIPSVSLGMIQPRNNTLGMIPSATLGMISSDQPAWEKYPQGLGIICPLGMMPRNSIL